MDPRTTTITLTFGDQAENHVGMERIGTMAPDGFNAEELRDRVGPALSGQRWDVEYIDLSQHLASQWSKYSEFSASDLDAGVLILRNGVDRLLQRTPYTTSDLFREQIALDVDRRVFMYGTVRNKHARYNLCFADYSQEPDYANGRGRIIDFASLPVTRAVREGLPAILGPRAAGMQGEGNYYYDVSKCGIGWHGDSERRRVVGVRLGQSMPLHYCWFYRGQPVTTPVQLTIRGGDIYVMSEKAVGTDWKRKVVPTLRHSAGARKYTDLPT